MRDVRGSIAMFDAKITDESEILDFLGENLPEQELIGLAAEFGFVAPNDYPFEKFLEPAQKKRFPRENLYDLEWAIYECGVERLALYSRPIQMYTSALYVYCNKIHQWGMCIESDFLYRVVKLELKNGVSPYSICFSKFIEWLHEFVDEDLGYQDFYLLLTWLLLSRLTSEAPANRMREVISYLLNKRLTGEDIDALSVSEYTRAHWLELHRAIPLADASLDADFEKIIAGSDAN